MIRWCNTALLCSNYIGICFSENDFYKELRRLKVKPSSWSNWLSDGALATTHFLESGKGNNIAMVCIPIYTDKDGIEIASILVHEAVHVLQDYFEYIGENEPGKETQAYALEAISKSLMFAYRDELYRQFENAVKKDEQEWTTSTISKPIPTASPSPSLMPTVTTTLLSTNALPEGMTLRNYSISLTKPVERRIVW
jgi:hypothetical protein